MPSSPPQAGTLFVVATPIGNLSDLSPRAASTLARVAVIAAEDTRTSQKLLPARDRQPRWISLHDHNEARATEQVIACLKAGDEVALVSDAGTPLVSDPGFRLVAAAHDAGLDVCPIPGPCAAIAALSAAGLASDRFVFEGFLPARSSARQRRIETLAEETATLIFYVPARDLPEVLADLASVLGGRRTAAIARELTKQFETVRRDSLSGLIEWTSSDADQRRGEAVVLVSGAERQRGGSIPAETLARELAAELPPARAARLVARLTGMARDEAFVLVESTRAHKQ